MQGSEEEAPFFWAYLADSPSILSPNSPFLEVISPLASPDSAF